ncbi:MAG: UDP-N-acetylmuramoylalanine--D-glutamate ligase [Halioglobus sp.]|jgi:UDP-N-acetylmuramoylalanine--D-glutamate ligase
MQKVIANRDNAVVVGLGSTGLSCARFLQSHGRSFCMVDTRSKPPGLEKFQREFPDVRVFVGEVPESILSGAGEFIVSPGVPVDDPLVVAAQAAGAQLIGDIDLFIRYAAAPIVGITGSNAKSTVTELVGQMARDAGTAVAVGGNLGVPALDLLSSDVDLYVLELSSFQLERAGQLNLAVATVLNISEDHLDRHGSMSIYQRAKHRIFQGCSAAVVNLDDSLTTPLFSGDVTVTSWRMGEPELRGFGLRVEKDVEFLSRQSELLMPTDELGLKGRHNIANALAALAIGERVGFSIESMMQTLREFRGLPHRCELVAEIDGVRYVNDSKGTNVGATEAALTGLASGKNIVLIAGGQGKGADFSVLKRALEKHCKSVVLIGEDAEKMRDSFSEHVEVCIAGSLEEAVAEAAKSARSGDLVLLSPACASFDMFSGYVERGDRFAATVQLLVQGEPS